MVSVRRNPHHSRELISRDMLVADITSLLPEAVTLLAEYGLQCVGCSLAGTETLEEGCRLHGFQDVEIIELLEDLNMLLNEMPKRPSELTVTLAAARALKKTAKGEGKKPALLVTADGRGGFCMEFQDDVPSDARAFHHPNEPSVRVLTTDLTLKRIGGATIDFREGRFKLDLL